MSFRTLCTARQPLTYQVCWRQQGHAGPHVTHDAVEWSEQSDAELGRLLRESLAEYFAHPGFLDHTVTRVHLTGVLGPGKLALELEFTAKLKSEREGE